MVLPRIVATLLFVALMVPCAGSVYSQDYPNKPVRILTGDVGGVGDITARLISQGLAETFGQPVIVENRGGSGSAIAPEIVAKAQPDAYTLLSDGGSFFISPLIQKMPYDVLKDFAPITQTTSFFYVLVANPAVAANSVQELIALAKSKPGVLNYGQFGTGGGSHLSAELFKSMAGVNIVNVPYKGSAVAANAIMAGEVQICFCVPSSSMPLVKAGKLKVLAITNSQPSALVPGVPTIAASGLPGYESVGSQGILVPTKTSPALIARLNREIVRILNKPESKQQFTNLGYEVKTNTPEEFDVYIKSELNKWGKLIKDIGLKSS